MKRNLIITALAAASLAAGAQSLKPDYITWPVSQDFPSYVRAWNAGETIKINGAEWEDEEFFISRVKPHQMFRNQNTQVDPSITEDVDKRLIWWVPIGDGNINGVHTDALPNSNFDSEAFSTWSYITHYGDWTSPHGWVPAALADVAHKNGVSVTGLASIPYGGITSTWRTSLESQAGLTAENIGKFLRYHGVNGLSYNSEFSGYNPYKIISQHENLTNYLAPLDPLYENIWYAGTVDGGGISFDIGLNSTNYKLFKDASYFLNYNWNNQSTMKRSIEYAENMGRDPLYLYAGFNMQGAEPRYGNNWDVLANYRYSIGLWGAHSSNMFWQERTSNGASPSARQRTYLNTCEQWFGNGPRNPAIRKPIVTIRQHRPSDDFFGMSAMMSARSALSWNLAEEPFFSCFNIGNGTFFNIDGKRVADNEWYNIGIQDYMPTWRFWFAPTLLKGDVKETEVSLNAEITWDDAWFGGSCLRINGSAANEYLHLFKTDFDLQPGDMVSVTYKLIKGSGNISLILSAKGSEDKPANENGLRIADVDAEHGTWITREFRITEGMNLNSLALIGLHFTGADNLDMRLGRIAVTRSSFATPETPVVKRTRILGNNYRGVDAKFYWSMPGEKERPEPTYNQDVNTSMFKMYAQEEGGDPVFIGMTTSWAGICYSAPNEFSDSRIRFGVSALSLDMAGESPIGWGEYMDKGEYILTDEIRISKSIIKPDEEFSLAFIDPQHPAATWTITATDGTEVFSASGREVTVGGISEIGSYDLSVRKSDGSVMEYPLYISISSWSVGALPEIQSIYINGEEVNESSPMIDVLSTTETTFAYRGRTADGSTSRGIDLNDNWFGVNAAEVSLLNGKPFSIAAWVKYNELPSGLNNFITIEDRATGGWPYNNWGLFWSRITDEGKFVYGSVDTAWGMRTKYDGTEGDRLYYRYDDAHIEPGTWTHVVIAFDYVTEDGKTKLRQHFYINGKKQRLGAWMHINKGNAESRVNSIAGGDWSKIDLLKSYAYASGFDTFEPEYVAVERTMTKNDWIAFGGSAREINPVKGCVDDFQIWDKVMTDEEVKLSMDGLDKENLPDAVLAYWDFENAPNNDKSFSAYGKKAGAKAYHWSVESGSVEGSGKQVVEEATFLPGCPFIAGTGYPITTTGSWAIDGVTVATAGSDTEGETRFAIPAAGDHIVTLTLANGYGEDTADYPVMRVTLDPSKVSMTGDNADVATFIADGILYIDVTDAGMYTLTVCDDAGKVIANDRRQMSANSRYCVTLPAKGIYAVRIADDSRVLRSAKIINR